jgi:hypothetical protein
MAMCISWTKGVAPPMRKFSALFDFSGYLDARYAVLAVGAFITMLGQFVPYYYISEC